MMRKKGSAQKILCLVPGNTSELIDRSFTIVYIGVKWKHLDVLTN